MAESKIEWTDYTFNPWWGCVEVSPACDHCYARTFAKRVGQNVWGKDESRRHFGPDYWSKPVAWNAKAAKDGVRRRVFSGSMCDVMEDRPDLRPSRAALYDLIERTPNLDWLLLSKRPQNFRRFLPASWLESPRPNVWLMTTVESADYLWRVKELVNTPAAIRGLSVEPLLGPISFRWAAWDDHSPNSKRAKQLPDVERGGKTLAGCVDELDGLRMLDWVIVGGESGAHSRPMNPSWALTIRDQCKQAGVAFLFKQWGEYKPARLITGDDDRTLKGFRYVASDGHVLQADASGVFPAKPEGTAVMERVGKHTAGRSLDGSTWDEYPR